MGWFSPLKGAYPSLAQIDKTLPVSPTQMESATKIVRGSLVYVNSSNEFELATASDATDATKYLYFALQGQDDFQAGMAGTIGQGPDGVWDGTFNEYGLGNIAAGAARITALGCGMPLEFQTDQFDQTVTAVGQLLTCGAGGKLAAHQSGDNVVAQVTAAPFERWVNDAVAVEGRRTGAVVSVIAARTMWLPLLVTAS